MCYLLSYEISILYICFYVISDVNYIGGFLGFWGSFYSHNIHYLTGLDLVSAQLVRLILSLG